MRVAANRSISAIAAALIVASACTQVEKAGNADYETPAAPAAPAPPKFTVGDFKKLGWLEGTWRGRMANGTPFHESYHVVNDSTIAMGGYTDSTFKTKSDSAIIAFRDGSIIDQGGGPVWHASTLDAAKVDFQSPKDRTSHFSWTRESNDRWTARLHSTAADGKEAMTVYVMERVKR